MFFYEIYETFKDTYYENICERLLLSKYQSLKIPLESNIKALCGEVQSYLASIFSCKISSKMVYSIKIYLVFSKIIWTTVSPVSLDSSNRLLVTNILTAKKVQISLKWPNMRNLTWLVFNKFKGSQSSSVNKRCS